MKKLRLIHQQIFVFIWRFAKNELSLQLKTNTNITQMSAKIILVTGGQRSGKSSFAENLALQLSPNPVYVATAHVWDEEFARRVSIHKARRGSMWTNIEEEKYISRHDLTGRVAVVDCITLWCTNFFTTADGSMPDTQATLDVMKEEFERLAQQEATLIFVTNEIGSGGVSANQLQRQFTDLQGWFNQYVAARANTVVLMVSGIPMTIKGKL